MKGFRARPAMPIRPHNSTGLPLDAVGYQDDARLCVGLVLPDNQNADFVVDVGNPHGAGEVPLFPVAVLHRLADMRCDALGQFRGFDLPPLIVQLAIELQGPDLPSRLAVGQLFTVDMVQNQGIREVTVEGEGAGNVLLTDPINQLLAPERVVLEDNVSARTGVGLLEPAEVQRIVFAIGTDLVDKEVVMGDFVPFLGMIPKPAGVFDQFTGVVDERVVDGDDALRAVAGRGVALQEVEPPLIHLAHIPGGVGQEAIQAGLVTCRGELPVDGGDILAGSDIQTGEVLGKVAALRFVGQQVTELPHSFLHNLGKLDNASHDRVLSAIRK